MNHHLKLGAMIGVCFLSCQSLWAWGQNHGLIGKIAYDNLPAWEQKHWQKWLADIPSFCAIPDAYYGDKEGLAKYVTLPNGNIIPHGLTDDKWRIVFECEGQSRDNARYVIRYYLEQIIQRMQAGDWQESVKFGGAFAHFIEDASSPGHVMNNYLVVALMPFPPGTAYPIHHVLEDDGSFTNSVLVTKVTPLLLGESVEEAAFQVENRHQQIVLRARAAIVPIVTAFYKGDSQAYTNALLQTASLSTELLASVWHTCFSIACKQMDPAEVAKTAQVGITGLVPDVYYSQPPCFIYMPGVVTDGKGKAFPIRLSGAAFPTNELGPDAFSVYGASLVAYSMPKGVYKSFSAVVGLDASNAAKAGEGFRVAVERTAKDRIEIEPNGQEIRDPYDKKWVSFSAWTNSKYIVYDSGIILAGEPAKAISVALPECERLFVITYRASDPPGHAVWAKGMFHKK